MSLSTRRALGRCLGLSRRRRMVSILLPADLEEPPVALRRVRGRQVSMVQSEMFALLEYIFIGTHRVESGGVTFNVNLVYSFVLLIAVVRNKECSVIIHALLLLLLCATGETRNLFSL